MPPTPNQRTRENRLRRKLRRMGYVLKKSRRRDADAIDYGLYGVLDIQHNVYVTGFNVYGFPFTMTLDEVEKWTRD